MKPIKPERWGPFSFLQVYPYWSYSTGWYTKVPTGMWPDLFSLWALP